MAPSPYRKKKIAGRTFQVHLLVWIAANGPIPPGMVVHHIDHDKRNNDIANLVLMTHQEHCEHHNQKYPRIKACEVCGTEYEPHPTKRKRSKTCSRPCAIEMMRVAAIEREAAKRASVSLDACRPRENHASGAGSIGRVPVGPG